MSRFAWIIILIALGIAFYNHFQGDAANEGSTEVTRIRVDEAVRHDGESPPIPESCEAASKTAENAMYGAAEHQVSFAQRNRAVRIFQSCLREEGLTDRQVQRAMAAKEEKVRRYLEMDKRG